jgi:hypothetical protein
VRRRLTASGAGYRAAMTVGPDETASAIASTLEHFAAGMPDGWFRRTDGVVAFVTGVALPALNGVLPERVDLDEVRVAALLDEVASSGLSYCLQLRPGSPPALRSVAAARGMVADEEVPAMVLDDPELLEAAQAIDGLVIRLLDPSDAAVHAIALARGFGVPSEPFLQLMTPALLEKAGMRCYVGEADGDIVTTGLGITLPPFVGVWNIATVPEQRRRGYGAAVTARAIADGFRAGASWSFLQSSPAGYAVYSALGFRTLERWESWIKGGSAGL